MPSLAAELVDILGTVRRPGDFFVSGTMEMAAPGLQVDGVGPIALPLLEMQAEQLVAAAERAPYGRGEATLVDTEVRRTWQIEAGRVRVAGRHWPRTLQAILERVAEGLGVADPIEAELYKLLVYDEGSFFVRHRDTEKAPGMFATLVLALPSTSTGGELLVRHRDREARLDLRCEDPSELAFAAFYADCVHEVRPVTAGCRLALVYNLLRRGRGARPEPPDHAGEQARLVALLRAWSDRASAPGEDAPVKLAYLLEHAYTPAELGFDGLKGADAAVAQVVAAAAAQVDCEAHLALVTVEESGIAEQTGHRGWRRRSGPEEEAFEIVEVTDGYVGASNWRRPDGRPSPLGDLPVLAEEIVPIDGFEDLEPDEQHFHEATGNEGASFDRTYRRAALLLWPAGRRLAVVNQAGLPVTLPYLTDLAGRWQASGGAPGSPLWRQAHELSAHMIAGWPMTHWYPRQGRTESEAAGMLRQLVLLGDAERLDDFLAALAGRGGIDHDDGPAIAEALGLLSPERAASLLEAVVGGAAAASLAACVHLLATATAASGRLAPFGAARALVDALPGDPARAAPSDVWRRRDDMAHGVVVELLGVLTRIDAGLAERAAEYMLAWPKTYSLDAVLLPALRALHRPGTADGPGAVGRLRAACLAHLRARAAEPLEAPRDWRRPAALGCGCTRCGELRRFLDNPEQKVWIYRAAAPDREHVEATIRRAACDLDLATERRGRPHSLICTKNRAGYERRAAQREADLADLDLLGG